MPEEPPLLTQQLVLVGGGHAHVAVLKSLGMDPVPGLRTILVSDRRDTPYSGMLPGFIAGHYSRDEIHVDLNRLARFARADFYCDRVTGLDADARLIHFQDRPSVAYDLLSLNIGSTPVMNDTPGAREFSIPVKPIHRFLAEWEALKVRVAKHSGDPLRFVIVGGGAGGVELTLSAQHSLNAIAREHGAPEPKFELITASGTLLQGHNKKVQRLLTHTAEARGITVRPFEKVVHVESGRLWTSAETEVPFDVLFWTTHAAAAPWLKESGLQTDTGGFIQVDGALRSLSHPAVFAAGDVAELTESPRPKSGVFAVREGALLARNLRLVALGFQPAKRRLQKSFLSLISTGDRFAVASKGPVCFSGGWVWRWKQRIDRKWMSLYRDLPRMKTGEEEMNFTAQAKRNLKIGDASEVLEHRAMRCGGCGAKVGAMVLHEVLKDLDPGTSSHVRVGLNARDDAAILAPPPGKLLVQTVDFFRSFISDPFLFGRIAANHFLNDIFAMGAEPMTAQAVATVPINGRRIMIDTLRQMLAGAAHGLKEHGACLSGGHSAESKELAFGLSVTGFLESAIAFRKTGLQEGDALILTKPLGTGVLLAADMESKLDTRALDRAIQSMLLSNRKAALILRAYGVQTCTDISGFGLIGHLREMLAPSPVAVELFTRAIPLLPSSLELSEAGISSSLLSANRTGRSLIESGQTPEPLVNLLFDPQTAGPLLATVDAASVDDVLRELQSAGYPDCAMIGRVSAAAAKSITLI